MLPVWFPHQWITSSSGLCLLLINYVVKQSRYVHLLQSKVSVSNVGLESAVLNCALCNALSHVKHFVFPLKNKNVPWVSQLPQTAFGLIPVWWTWDGNLKDVTFEHKNKTWCGCTQDLGPSRTGLKIRGCEGKLFAIDPWEVVAQCLWTESFGDFCLEPNR